MCGGSKKAAAPAPAAPTYQYFPEASRNPQQQAAGVVASGAQSNATFGSELSAGGSAPAPAPTTGGM